MTFSELVGRIFNRAKTQPEPTTSSRLFFVGRTAAGVRVTPDTALQDATVWACIQYLTKAVGPLPWRVYQERANGSKQLANGRDGADVDWLIHHRPNPDMGSFTWRASMLGMALIYGNAYAEIEWTNRRTPFALWPIHPERVAVRRNEAGRLEYEVWNRGGNVVLGAEDVFHLRGFGDGPVGYNVIEYAAQSIGWAMATQLFGASYFGEGMNPSGIIETPNALSPLALDELKASLKKLYAGPKGERTAVLDAGMKFNKVTSSAEESQFIETRQHQVEEICRWFGVPPHKVMHLLRATFSNIEHQSIEVVTDSVAPWAKRFEEEANYKFFGNTRSGLYTKINLNGLLRGDNSSRIAFYKGMFELGMTINQILALEELNGIGADGDVSFVSNNVQTLRRAIEGKPLGQAPVDDEAAPPPKPNGAANGHAAGH